MKVKPKSPFDSIVARRLRIVAHATDE